MDHSSPTDFKALHKAQQVPSLHHKTEERAIKMFDDSFQYRLRESGKSSNQI